jgi:hypothetical protein
LKTAILSFGSRPDVRIHVLRGPRGRHFLERVLHLPQAREHLVAERAPRVEEIARLARIVLEVVELRARGVDGLVAARPQRLDVAPPVVVERVHGLGVALEPQFRPVAGHERQEGRAGHLAGHRHAQQGEHRRHKVDDADGVGDRAPAQALERRPNHEGDAGRGLVDEEPVRVLTVIAEALAVVAQDRDHRAVQQIPLPEERDDPADLGVGEGDFAAVRMSGVLGLVGLGRIVRRVRVVQVDPREERPALRLVDPRQRLVDDLVGGPLDAARRPAAGLHEVEVV